MGGVDLSSVGRSWEAGGVGSASTSHRWEEPIQGTVCWICRLGLPSRWSRALEGQELGLLGCRFLKLQSDQVKFIKRWRIAVSLQGLGNMGQSNPPQQGKIISFRVRDYYTGSLGVKMSGRGSSKLPG